MPKCKNCQREITKNDYDLCPYCGEKNPIPTNYETMDVTSVVARIGTQELPRARKTNVFRLLAATLGLFGVHWFYIFRSKWGYLTLGTTLLGIAAFGTAFYFACWQNWLIYLIVFGGFWLFHLVYGLAYGSIDNLKDGKGEFLR